MPRERKPLPEGCTGDFRCEVEGHVIKRHYATGYRVSHIKLTRGQTRTLHERRAAANRELNNKERAAARMVAPWLSVAHLPVQSGKSLP